MKQKYRGICACVLLLGSLFLGAGALAGETQGWDEATATVILLEGNQIQVRGKGASAEGGVVTLTQAGTYVVRGTLDDGQIVVDADKANVLLVLDGAHLTSATSAPIYARQVKTLTLYLAEGSENTVTDAEVYVFAEGTDEPDAAIFCKDDMVITGGGALTVRGNYRNGIASKDDLTLLGGQVDVTAVHDGIRGRDALYVQGGSYTVAAGNDGLKANNPEVGKGFIEISGGSLTITAVHDGIQAETSLTVTGGTLEIESGGGVQNAQARQEEWGPGRGGPAQSAAGEEDTGSFKGLKAGGNLVVQGGAITVDAAEDALHANGDVTVTGGMLTLSAGDDAVHADGALLVEDGIVEVLTSYEGLEGATVEIRGGDIRVTASDDGLNAAGGSDGEDLGGGFGRDHFRQMAASDDTWIEISGGTVAISAQGDGLDSNGNLTVTGGDVVVHGPTSGGNGALDASGEILVSGGTLVAAGSSGMAETPGAASTQNTLAYYYAATQPAGTTVTLLGGDGSALAAYTAEKDFQMVLFSLPTLAEGGLYTLDTDGKVAQVTLSGVVTAVSSDGSPVSTGGFGGRGGHGGRW